MFTLHCARRANHRLWPRAVLATSLWALTACCGSPPTVDAGADSSMDAALGVDASSRCAADLDCDDGLFCNGVERCAPASAAAAVDGCTPGEPPCGAMEICQERDALCLTECDRSGDADGDGHLGIDCGGDDCDDADANRFPGNTEVCDSGSHDEDCDPETFGFIDADMDGAGSDHCCNLAADGSFRCGGDCDDADGSVRPGAGDGPPAACDGLDNDCDGVADEGCPCVEGETRACGASAAQIAGVGACEPGTQICAGGAFTEVCVGGRAPASEICDGVDNDCDGTVDNGVLATFYRDLDGDGFGVSGATTEACSAPAGWAPNTLDCDDTNPAVSPVGTEVCDGANDENCDGRVDEGLTHTYYADADGDGFGDRDTTRVACFRPDGFSNLPTDCDDGNAAVNPASPEVCDGAIDENCAGGVDEGCACTNGLRKTCGPRDAAGALMTAGICRSGEQLCSGGLWGVCAGAVDSRVEVCNGLDDDCDGSVDEGVTASCYADGDGDGYGTGARLDVCATTPGVCPAGFAANPGDCNESNAAVNPGASEVCDGMDNDCDGVVDTDGAGDCVQNQILPCATSCGSSGTTSCDASCHFRPPGPACAALTEVCNYCDDNLDGTTDDERAIALSTEVVQGMCEQPGTVYGEVGTLYGSARCVTDLGLPTEPSDVWLGMGGTAAYWYDRPTTFGYRGVTVDVVGEASIDPACGVLPGFAIVLAADTGSTLGADADLGVPLSRVGVALEWRTNGAAADQVTLRQLTGSGPGDVIRTATVPLSVRIDDGSRLLLAMRLAWTPADPLTGELERLVFQVKDRIAGPWLTVLTTDGLAVFGLFSGTGTTVGTPIRMGITAPDAGSCGTFMKLNIGESVLGTFTMAPTRMTASGQCATAPGSLRIVGGDGRSGRLEINHAGSWGSVCSDRFGNVDARVACRQLGFSTGTVLAATSVKDGADPIWMDELACSGGESRLDECGFGAASCGADPWGCQNCTHAKDVGVSCVP